MKPESSRSHWEGLSNNPFQSRINPIPCIDTYFFKFHPNIALAFKSRPSKGLFPINLPVKILREFLHPFIMATWPAYLNLLDLITLSILGERYKQWRSSLWNLHSLFSLPIGPNIHLRSCFQIPLVWILTYP